MRSIYYMESEAEKYFRPRQRRATVHRLPLTKTVALKFPTRPNPDVNKIYIGRKIPIINTKNYKNLQNFNKADLFIGSLRIF